MDLVREAACCLLLGWSAVGVLAQEVQWRPAARSATPAAAAASLGRPVSARPGTTDDTLPVVDPHVRPASYAAPSQSLPPRLIRLQNESPRAVLPLPTWGATLPASPTAKSLAAPRLPAAQVPVFPPPTVVSPAPPTAMAQAVPSLPSGQVPVFPPPTVVWPVPNHPAPQQCGHVCLAPEPMPGRVYGSAEYLLWWIKDSNTPALITTSPVPSQGILGQPGTVVLFGGDVNNEERSGARFTAGYWLDPCHTWAVEGSYFFLGERAARFGANSDQFSLLARPFFNVNEGIEFSQVVTDPGRAAGGIGVLMPSELWSAELNLRRNLCCGCGYRVDLIGGFRYLDLHEGVNVQEIGTLLQGAGPLAGNQFRVFDDFDTRNQFYGGQLGAETELRRGRWFVNMRGKVALGVNHETINITGGQVLTAPDGTVSRFRGGLLALPSNMGTFHRNHFAVVPEGGINLGFHVTESLRAYVGYTFLYWNNVFRPGEQIDRVLDVNQIPNFTPGPPTNRVRPTVPFSQTDFWAQGLNFGLEYRY